MELLYCAVPETCEDIEKYVPGGYHPVSMNDRFSNGRYEVVHKLGHGGFATVWLAQDTQQNRLVALKILTADSSRDGDEIRIHLHLQNQAASANRTSTWSTPLLDHFEIRGPNGTHICLVLPFLGPSLGSFQRGGSRRKIRPDVGRKLASQIAEAISDLHLRGVVVGDVSPSNILLRLRGADSWTTDDVRQHFGEPESYLVELNSCTSDDWPDDWAEGQDLIETPPSSVDEEHSLPNKHAPKYVYEPIAFLEASPDILEQKIMLVDFGESSITDVDRCRTKFGVNPSYTAPEIHFAQIRMEESDIWALACCIFEMRSAKQLFQGAFFGGGITHTVVKTLGPLPQHWEKRLPGWELRQAMQTLGSSGLDPKWDKDCTLREKVEKIGKWPRWCYWTPEERKAKLIEQSESFGMPAKDEEIERQIHRGPNPPGPLSKEECEDFTNLLSGMLKYERAERTRMEQIMKHPWFSRKYNDDWDWSGPWLQRYDPGRYDFEQWWIDGNEAVKDKASAQEARTDEASGKEFKQGEIGTVGQGLDLSAFREVTSEE